MLHRNRLFPVLAGTLLFILGGRQAKAMSLPASSQDSITHYEVLIDSSFMAGNLGDYPRAESYLRQALRLAPKGQLQAMLLNNLGGLQLLQGKDDAALLSFGAALEQSPNDPTTRYNRAQLFVRKKNYKAALTDLSLLISAYPKNELYHYQRAMVYLLTKEYDLAENDLRAIIDGNGESLKARVGFALLETMRGNYNEAERLYAYLTDKLPRNAEVYEGRARMFLARGMRGFAQRDINLAFEYAQGKAPATLYRLRAELHESLGNEKEAEEDRKQAETLERKALIR